MFEHFALIVEDVVVLHCRWDDEEDMCAHICRGTGMHILNKSLNPQQGSKGRQELNLSQLLRVPHNPQSLGCKDPSFP